MVNGKKSSAALAPSAIVTLVFSGVLWANAGTPLPASNNAAADTNDRRSVGKRFISSLTLVLWS